MRGPPGYISHMCSADQFAANMKLIEEHAAAANRGAVDFEAASFLFTVLDDDYERALDRAARMLGTIYNRDFRDAAKKYCLLGRPEDCLDQMRAFARAGSRHFVFSLLSDVDEFVASFEKVIRPEVGALVG